MNLADALFGPAKRAEDISIRSLAAAAELLPGYTDNPGGAGHGNDVTQGSARLACCLCSHGPDAERLYGGASSCRSGWYRGPCDLGDPATFDAFICRTHRQLPD